MNDNGKSQRIPLSNTQVPDFIRDLPIAYNLLKHERGKSLTQVENAFVKFVNTMHYANRVHAESMLVSYSGEEQVQETPFNIDRIFDSLETGLPSYMFPERDGIL